MLKVSILFSEKEKIHKNSIAERLKNISQRISSADVNENTDLIPTESDITRNVLAQRMHELKEESIKGASQSMDKEIYFSRNRKIGDKAQAIPNFSYIDVINSKKSFHKWMFVKHDLKQCTKMLSLTGMKSDTIISDDSSKKSTNSTTLSKISDEYEVLQVNNYGRIQLDRFEIPFTMLDKAHRYHGLEAVKENVLRRVRLSHMSFNQPPLSEDSSNDDGMQNVKRLALVQTPYFLIPLIKVQNDRRNAEFHNRYLQKERLRRINLLFHQQKEFAHFCDKKVDVELVADKLEFYAPKYKECDAKVSNKNFIKEKIISIIRSNFGKLLRICEPCVTII